MVYHKFEDILVNSRLLTKMHLSWSSSLASIPGRREGEKAHSSGPGIEAQVRTISRSIIINFYMAHTDNFDAWKLLIMNINIDD